MSQQFRPDSNGQAWASPSEREIHTEHLAALDATLFRESARAEELVLELVAGELRVRPTR
jgi:hypothetical protein